MKWKSLIALGILALGCGSPTHKIPQNINEITNSDISVSEEINQIEDTIFINEGIWTSKDDSLSKIEINKKKWIFRNGDYANSYNYNISSAYFNEEKTITNGRLTLSNLDDTMQYGIYKISDDTISLIYLSRGNFLTYYK
ncbi:MAG: hypothetical protein VX926_06165 [Bacteroidota bacterium]|nr:hypothetical protein [Bacteroidota bacterium]